MTGSLFRRRFGRWLLCLTPVAACLSAVRAQTVPDTGPPREAQIRGRVLDGDGLPVPHALAALRHVLNGSSERTETGDTGEFAFSRLSAGRYWITITAPAFAEYSRSIEVSRDEVLTLDPVRLTVAGLSEGVTVVSGSRVEELQQDSPVRVEVLTREQMTSTGYERVSDLLSEVPGVITRRGSTATAGGEQIQGIDSRQVLVLQDGLPLVGARGIKSGVLNLNRQGVGKLERVEVVKGAASSLYGTDAIGGVINLITREPSAPFQGGFSLSGGTLGAFDGRADVGTRWKKLTLFADLETHRQDAYGLIPGDRSTVGPELRRHDGLGKARYTFSPRAALGISVNAYHNHEVGRNLAQTGLTKGTSNDSMQTWALTGDFLLNDSTTLQTRAYAARYDENSRIDLVGSTAPSFGFANLNERYHRLDATIGRQLGRHQLLQGGVEWVQDLYRGANRLLADNAGQQITTTDVWLQDRIELTSRATLTAGGRVTTHSLFGSYAVPKLGLVVRLTDRLIVRGSFGKGFRAPDPGQLYFRFANPASFYQVIGNPALQPETSASYSGGLQYRASRYNLGLSLYRNDLNGLIDTLLVGTPRTRDELTALLVSYGIPATFDPLLNRQTFFYRNLNRARTQGFELNGDVALTSRWRFHGAYTFLQAVDRATGLTLPQRHRHQGLVKADYINRRRGLSANLRGTFFSQWLLNPAAGTTGAKYQLWDLYAAHRLRRGLQTFGAVDNLADSTDRKLRGSPPGFDRPDYGRTFRVGLRYRFGGAE